MATDSSTDSHAPRLNPFVFPSDTTFRFVLLIVFVLGASLSIYSSLYLRFLPAEWRLLVQQCLDDVLADYPITDEASVFTQGAALSQCVIATSSPGETVAWTIGGVSVLLIVAGVLYWTAPALKIWRERLVPLSDEDAPEVVDYLTNLCREAGLSRPPTFLLNPLNLTSSGLAFGRLRRYYVVLNGGLVTQFYTDRLAFRAVILHELAHLRNADINKTYFAVAVWRAFVIVALIPFAIGHVYAELVASDNSNWPR